MRKRCKDDDEDEDFVDFEDSGDDYRPSESSDSDVDMDIEANSPDSSEDESNVNKLESRIVLKALPNRRSRFSTRQQDFVFESDKYFGHTNRKVRTGPSFVFTMKFIFSIRSLPECHIR